MRRMQSGQAAPLMINPLAGKLGGAPFQYLADWTDRVAKGELPHSKPQRPQGVERNIVVTMWDWGDAKTYLHDEIATDKRNPTVNAYGKIYSATEDSTDNQEVVDRLARNVGQIEVGLALGAGAAKGFAHIGVLKTLEEHQIPVDYVVGCSIGAIVGAMYAGGLPFAEIEERMQGADRKVRRWHLPLRSVWSDAGLKELLRDPAPTARFRDLQTAFAVVATDVATGREIVIRKGLIWRAVQASASVPGIFPPALIQNRHLVDGGLVNPVPSQTVRDLGADIVIAVDLMSPSARTHHIYGPVKNSRGNSPVPNLVEMLWRANEIMQEEVTLRSAATADITIEPRLGRVRWSDSAFIFMIRRR